ncbi:uncharacterized protein LOC129586122 [Paramacrobiotus metropolitanus]|uniref:uncharacterized protein LOC129586122 n=1 Tax=Paramacrobiotus metropolitanus TaxID=2943436 RepID=UPI002445EEF7|nr:uncharacterized protein LOC129586122 [Paramacrobiotus metropolitanus]
MKTEKCQVCSESCKRVPSTVNNMTSIEVDLACVILRHKFGQTEAAVGRVLLENGEMLISDIHRRAGKVLPRARLSEKPIENILHKFYQNDLLAFNSYPELSEEEPFISMDLNRIFYFIMEPALCQAAEEILGEAAAQVLSVIFAFASATAVDVIKELEKLKGTSEMWMVELRLLVQARAVVVFDPLKKPSDELFRIDPDAAARKQSWTSYVLKPNYHRLFVIFLLHLMRNRLENDSAVHAGREVFLGLCRAAILSTPRIEFCCDESFQPVTGELVFNSLPDNVKDGYDLSSVVQNLTMLASHSDGFLGVAGETGFVLKGARLLGVWSEQFLYDVLRAELPKVQLARTVMHYLIRNPKPYVQLRALESELFAHTSQLRFGVNELCRLGYIDLMGTSHVAQFEPGRTEHFLFVDLPRLYRQKILYEQCKSLLRNFHSLKRFKDMEYGIESGNTSLTQMNHEAARQLLDTHAKMELGYLDCFIFSVIYLRATRTILQEQISIEANTLVEFYNRNSIPDD